ncbi:MAG: hypothetical protein ACXABY_15365 [Candidatus Thorarchaeota archaeon]
MFIGGSDITVPEHVLFVGEGVPYWQKCQHDLSLSREEIKRTFEFALKNYILKHTDEFLDFFGKNVTFDLPRLDVDANILRDKIVLTVTLPTTVNGYDIREPYTREVSTKFGEIIDFAADVAKEFSVNRELEYFTIYSIYFSKNLWDGHPKLPTIGVMTQCGENVLRSPRQISRYLLETAEYVLTNTFWWRGLSTSRSRSRTFGIEDVNGERYMDLNIKMHLPDDFAFAARGRTILFTNNELLLDMDMFVIPRCVSAYKQVYDVSYPVVISVDDPLSGNSFNFGSMVHVTDSWGEMSPGRCDFDITKYTNDCKDLECNANIRVVWHKYSDGSNEPLEGALVTIGDCFGEKTDSDGHVEGPVECGLQELSIYHNSSFGFYSEIVSSSELSGTYELHYKPGMTAHFRKVVVENDSDAKYRCLIEGFGDNEFVIGKMDSGSGEYGLYNTLETSETNCMDTPECQECMDVNTDGVDAIDDINICRTCQDLCTAGDLESDVDIDYIPSGDYFVDVSVRDIQNGYEKGKIDLDYRLSEDTEDLYVYIPDIGKDVFGIDNSDGEDMEDIVVNRCGIDLITTEMYQEGVYYYE